MNFKGASKVTTSSVAIEDSYGLKIVACGNDPVVDIVAVHGLNGHWDKTWTEEKSGTMWLRDLLPSQIPDARILSYGYNANTFGNFAKSRLSLRNHGTSLAQHLLRVRNDPEIQRRPIIFIAHDVGGILIKHALVYCNSVEPGHLEEFKVIKTSTHGILFFGTPHSGQTGAELGQILVNICGIFTNTNDNIIKHLQFDSEYLSDLGQQYLPISNSFKTVFFYEALESSVMGKSILLVPQSSAVISGIQDSPDIPINKDHFDMVKYSSEKDSDYKTVFWYIAKMVTGVKEANQFFDKDTKPRTDVQSNPKFLLDFYLPFQKNHHFLGRDKELVKLHNIVKDAGIGQRQIAVLYGMAGVGKTEIAVEYIWQHHKEYSSIFWLDATSRATLESSFVVAAERLVKHLAINSDQPNYIDIAKSLNIVGKIGNNGRQLLDVGHEALSYIVDAVTRWLSLDGNNNWLLVFDNLDDIGSFNEHKYFPMCLAGTIIITSCMIGSLQIGQGIKVDVMEEMDAVDLLLTKSANVVNESNLHLCLEITQELGYLPLAIEQAAAYIWTHQLSLHEYLPLYKRKFTYLMDKDNSVPTRHEQTIYRTLGMAFDKIREKNVKAAELLLLYGFLSNDVLNDLILLGRSFSEDDLDAELELLLLYSLVRRNSEKKTIWIHPVVHRWAREYLTKDKRIVLAQKAIKILAKSIVLMEQHGLVEQRTFERRILPDLEAWYNIFQTNDPGLDYMQQKIWDSIFTMAMSFFNLGLYSNMEGLLQPLSNVQSKHFGSMHADSIRTRGGLAICYDFQGKHSEAKNLYVEVLCAREKVLGMEAPDTIRTKGNLANLYSKQKQYTQAQVLYMQILIAQERALGLEHSETIGTRMNLENCYSKQGKYSEAERLYKQIVCMQITRLGEDHPETVRTQWNLASCYANEGKHSDAERLYTCILSTRERLLGCDDNYPDIIVTREILARCYRKQKKHSEAEKLYKVVLSGQEKTLGHSHYSTIATRKIVALYQKKEKLEL